MKRIALSLAAIGMVVAMSAAATGAYFSDTVQITGNTFSTGSVVIGSMSGTHLNETNLEPGVWTQAYPVDVPYVGSLNADLYVGVTGTSTPANLTSYIANELTVEIVNSTGTVVYDGLASGLSSSWAEVATNIGPNTWNDFNVYFQLPSTDTTQGILNTDTDVLLYAQQAGAPAPTSIPYEITAIE
jgi:predicted ribosomally synthesized peptide with SipW-like signal peptide